eukprot:PhF_6_TR660/c0_g1_i2/m.968
MKSVFANFVLSILLTRPSHRQGNLTVMTMRTLVCKEGMICCLWSLTGLQNVRRVSSALRLPQNSGGAQAAKCTYGNHSKQKNPTNAMCAINHAQRLTRRRNIRNAIAVDTSCVRSAALTKCRWWT